MEQMQPFFSKYMANAQEEPIASPSGDLCVEITTFVPGVITNLIFSKSDFESIQ